MIKDYYEKYWSGFKEAEEKTPFSTRAQQDFFVSDHSRYLAGIFSRAPGRKVLNAGCGKGTHSLPLEKQGFRVVNADYSFEALLLTRDYYSYAGLKPLLVRCDINSLPFKQNSFDVVVNFGVMEHFKDIAPIYKEMTRALKQKGILHSEVITKRLSVHALERFMAVIFSFFYNLLTLRFRKLLTLIRTEYCNQEFYENSYPLKYYLEVLKEQGIVNLRAIGIRPYPFIRLPHKLDRFYASCLKFSRPLINKIRSSWLSETWLLRNYCPIWFFYGERN